jgi:hypothetical protein
MYTITTVIGFSVTQHIFQLDLLSVAILSPTPHTPTVHHDNLVDTQEEHTVPVAMPD